jgi:hypothetical protein
MLPLCLHFKILFLGTRFVIFSNLEVMGRGGGGSNYFTTFSLLHIIRVKSNDRMENSWERVWKRKRSWPNSSTIPTFALSDSGKSRKNLSRDSLCSNRDLNRPKYKSLKVIAILTSTIFIIGYSVAFTPLHYYYYYLLFWQFSIILCANFFKFFYILYELRNIEKPRVKVSFRNRLQNHIFLVAEGSYYAGHYYFISPSLKFDFYSLYGCRNVK